MGINPTDGQQLIASGAKSVSGSVSQEIEKILSDFIKKLSVDKEFLKIYEAELREQTAKVQHYKTKGGKLSFSTYLVNTYGYVSKKLRDMVYGNSSPAGKYLRELSNLRGDGGPLFEAGRSIIAREGWHTVVSETVDKIFENTAVKFKRSNRYLVESIKINFNTIIKRGLKPLANKMVTFFTKYDPEFTTINGSVKLAAQAIKNSGKSGALKTAAKRIGKRAAEIFGKILWVLFK